MEIFILILILLISIIIVSVLLIGQIMLDIKLKKLQLHLRTEIFINRMKLYNLKKPDFIEILRN